MVVADIFSDNRMTTEDLKLAGSGVVSVKNPSMTSPVSLDMPQLNHEDENRSMDSELKTSKFDQDLKPA